jgi:hypothetical protein
VSLERKKRIAQGVLVMLKMIAAKNVVGEKKQLSL